MKDKSKLNILNDFEKIIYERLTLQYLFKKFYEIDLMKFSDPNHVEGKKDVIQSRFSEIERLKNFQLKDELEFNSKIELKLKKSFINPV